MIGEFGSIITAFIWILHWRRKPPFGLPSWVAISLLIAAAVGVGFLFEYIVTDAISKAIGYDGTASG
jgi:hypothetical protein